jgi:hypothetical protein
MIDVWVVLVQFCSQALRFFFFKESGASSYLPADCGFPMDSVRFHCLGANCSLGLIIHFSAKTATVEPTPKRGWRPSNLARGSPFLPERRPAQ